jgi:putative transposase
MPQRAPKRLLPPWMAETKKDALSAFDAFVETWDVKYDRLVECLVKDRDALLDFYVPAEHWTHLRTTNVMKSRSRRFVTAPCARRDVSRTRQHWP